MYQSSRSIVYGTTDCKNILNNYMRKTLSFSFVAEIDANVEKYIRQSQEGEMSILALRDNILFPGTVTPVTVGRKKSLKALKKQKKPTG